MRYRAVLSLLALLALAAPAKSTPDSFRPVFTPTLEIPPG